MLAASCASTNGSTPISTDTPANHLNRLVDASEGDSLELEGATWAVERSYIAASGRLCKRLRGSSGQLRVGCRNIAREWYLRKPLTHGGPGSAGVSTLRNTDTGGASANTGSNSVQAVDAVSVDESETVDLEDIDVELIETGADSQVQDVITPAADVPAQSLRVRENENLWRFSKRVTGNALNWEKIAQFNQLDNARSISAGQHLRVPVEWLVPGAGN